LVDEARGCVRAEGRPPQGGAVPDWRKPYALLDLISRKRGRSTMFRLKRTSVTAWVAVVAVIAGVAYVLTRAVPPASAQPKAGAAPVEFTADGKLKQPVGYRKWVYV